MTLLRYDGICQANLLIIIEKNEKCEDFCVIISILFRIEEVK